ncbi:MAG: flagellar hook capping protein [Gemmatimonadetes bacterium]|nr:flagellar hook capping protein [Gemmatimonadota bacterium]NNF12938.1 flagellar hook capping protein [Gemmatimonadota bacterium]
MLPPVEGASAASGLFGPGSLDKEDFLRLLVTQLQYQDPLDPLDAQDFASQLAEFTALEQQLNTNQLIEQQIEMTSASMVESQNSVAIGLIGNGIVADGDHVELTGEAGDAAYIHTSGPATVTIEILDASGSVVLTTSVAVTEDGLHRVDLGSASDDLAAGHYTLSVEVAAGVEGTTARPLASGVVQGVRWGDDGPVLVVGDTEVPLSGVLEITNGQETHEP